jgi:hypothetical protein
MSGTRWSPRGPLTLKRNLLAVVLAATVLVVPSRLGPFDGVPLESKPELGLLLLLAPLLLSRVLRERAAAALGRVGRWVAVGALVVALAAKLVLLAAAPNDGFDSCYRSPLAPPLSGDCEVSFADPFQLSGGTRVDEQLEFGPRRANPAAAALYWRLLVRDGALTTSNWNLSFFNSQRFNFLQAEPGAFDRNRLPFELSSEGNVEFEHAGRLDIVYVGQGRLMVGNHRVELAPAYRQVARAVLPVDAGRQRLQLRFAFNRVARNNDPPTSAPYATLMIGGPEGEPLKAAPVALGWATLAGVITFVLAATALALAALYLWLLRSFWWLGVALVPALWLAHGVDSPHSLPLLGELPPSTPYIVVLVGLLLALSLRPGPHPMLAAWIGIVAVAAVRTFEEFPYDDSVLYPNGGDDPLTYESQAYHILATASPQGEEDVFFYQPGYRYVLFAGRLLLGPNGPPLSLLGLAGLAAGVFFLADRLRSAREGPAELRAGALLAGALMLGVVWADLMVGNLRVLNTEWITWILLPFGAGLLLGAGGFRTRVAGVLLLALEGTVRLNQLPVVTAVLGIFLLSLAPRERLSGFLACLACLPVLALPLLHNVAYGGQFTFFTTNAGSADVIGVEPSRLLDLPSDSAVRDRVGDQLARAFYLPPLVVNDSRPDVRVDDVKLYVYGLELLWLAALAAASVFRRRLSTPALVGLALPLVALLPYAVYDLVVYYPRHPVIGWLAMGIAVLLVCSPRSVLATEQLLRGRLRSFKATIGRVKRPAPKAA